MPPSGLPRPGATRVWRRGSVPFGSVELRELSKVDRPIRDRLDPLHAHFDIGPLPISRGLRLGLETARRLWYRLEIELPERVVVRRQYRRRNGMDPDLNRPRDLSEKICWLKLYGMTEPHRRCADKVAVRGYVRAAGAGDLLTRAHLVTADPDDIAPDRIAADRFVAKANHDSGTVVICADRHRFDWAAARRRLRIGLRRDFSRRYKEKQYRGFPRLILVEEFIPADDGGTLVDYKVFCFHGVPTLVQLDLDRHRDHRQAFFDPAGRQLDIRRHFPPAEKDLRPPLLLTEMLAVAARLSRPFPFCRVDLYMAQGRLWFGEISFTPDAGLGRFQPPEVERYLGDLLDLSAVDCGAEAG